MWSKLAVAVGVCLGSGALVYVTRQSEMRGPETHPQRGTTIPERQFGAGMALAGVLGETGML